MGKDLTSTLNYFGSANSKIIASEFSADQQRDFTIRKELLWESEDPSDSEVNRVESNGSRPLAPTIRPSATTGGPELRSLPGAP